MNKAGRIISVNPPYAIAGGEISIECENFQLNAEGEYKCVVGGKTARLIGASETRILAIVPADAETSETEIYLESGGEQSERFRYTIGKKLADDLHIVANPAIDPKDDSIIVTRSGARGQQLPVTMFRLETDGYLNEMPAEILNPTAVAFNRSGNLFATNRSDGEVSRINRDEEVVPYASNLGIATGIAFDKEDVMYVGDRSGTIYRVKEFGSSESFALLDPSVSAYHLAFGADNRLYVTAPGLSSFDAVYVIDEEGYEEKYFRGFGRPQGLAFDKAGNLYVAACFQGKHGVARIKSNAESTEMFVAGMNVVGLCFTRQGEMIVATNDSVYSIPVGIYGTLLD
ncbi:MAG: gluconolaconase [Acidobacteriota bacterium]|nr:gluconolaconase [Acidobacteriota bacterium]